MKMSRLVAVALISAAVVVVPVRTQETPAGVEQQFGKVAPGIVQYTTVTHLAFYAGWPNAFSALQKT
jgi:hypothetical protein